MEQHKWKAAVIGLGDISGIHLAALKNMDNVELAAVCDSNGEKRGAVPGVPFYTDYKEMLQTARPDCVHICLPHYLHYPVSRAVAEAGCHVFCEKPVALNGGEAEEFARLEREHPEIKMGVCLQNRRNESVERLLEILESGEAGKVTGVTATVLWARLESYYRAAPWRGKMDTAGGGVMINQSIHTLDLMRLFGGPIARVSGRTARLLDYGLEVEDTASARLEFESGAVGFFSATVGNSRNDSVSLSVVAEKAEYRIADNILYCILPEGKREQLAEDARLPGEKFYYGASHAKLIGEFYHCLETGSDRYIHVSEGVLGSKIIDAVCESSAQGRPVPVSI